VCQAQSLFPPKPPPPLRVSLDGGNAAHTQPSHPSQARAPGVRPSAAAPPRAPARAGCPSALPPSLCAAQAPSPGLTPQPPAQKSESTRRRQQRRVVCRMHAGSEAAWDVREQQRTEGAALAIHTHTPGCVLQPAPPPWLPAWMLCSRATACHPAAGHRWRCPCCCPTAGAGRQLAALGKTRCAGQTRRCCCRACCRQRRARAGCRRWVAAQLRAWQRCFLGCL
jgi:hypothetical protein